MTHDWLGEAGRLRGEGRAFALATVVGRRPPQSARLGARAIVRPDGRMTGWIGGGCVRPTVLREALAALGDGRPRLVRVDADASPDDDDRAGVRVYPMTCEGEGAVDVYIEPVLPKRMLMVYGATPVAEALVRLAEPLGFATHVAHPAASADRFAAADAVHGAFEDAARATAPGAFVVVATQGDGDAEALAAALSTDEPAYVGLVASPKKGGRLLDRVRESGVAPERIDRVKCPAGLDLGGMAAPEVALSILAEIVQRRAAAGAERAEDADGVGRAERARGAAADDGATATTDEVTAVDPVCGMAVEIATSRHRATHDGRTFHFCCPHCKSAFEDEAERYAAAASAGGSS